MARSVPELMTVGLARVLDQVGVGRLLGEPVEALLADRPVSAGEWDRLEAADAEDGALELEEPEVLRRYQAGAIWQALGWAWFVLGIAVTSVFLVAGNSPVRPGFAAWFVYPVVSLATATCVGNLAVCLGIGRGRTSFGRAGGGNVVWLLVAVPFWALMLLPLTALVQEAVAAPGGR